MKLISSKNFGKTLKDKTDTEYRKLRDSFDNFLDKSLEVGMFVPVDKHGVILEDLKYCCDGKHCGCMGMPVNVCSHKQIDEYYVAKERVLFKGFYVEYNAIISPGGGYLDDSKFKYLNIESLVSADLILTDNALKQIGL